MRSILPIFFGFLLFTLGAYAQTCHVSAVTTARSGATYPVQNGIEQIYDVVVTNDGSCGVNDIGLIITLPTGASISSSWNLQNDGSYYQVTSYGSVLPVQSAVNVGFIVYFPNTQTVPSGVSVTVYGELCNACSSPSSTTSTTTSSSTTGTPNGNCHVTAVTTARNGGSYQVQGGFEQIYDVVVTNDGSCGVNDIELTITLPNGASISSKWNLNVQGSTYQVTSYGSVLPVGSAVNVGFIAFFPNAQSVPSGVSVSVASTTCNQCNSGSSTTSPSTTASSSTTTSSSTTGTPNGNCHVTAVTTARNGGSYQVQGGFEQIYDVVVTNDGSCGVNDIELTITLPNGASISSQWNLNVQGSTYQVTSYGSVLPVGNPVTVGFIAFFPNAQSVPSGVSVSVASTTCNQCNSGSSTTSPSTTASSSTTTSSSTTGTPNGNCHVTAVTTARNGGSYQSGNGVSQIYDVVITNDGSCNVDNIIVNINLPDGATISSLWNINPNGGSLYTVTNYGSPLTLGATANPGFIVNFPNTQNVPSGVSLSVSTTTCNTCNSASSSSTTGSVSTTSSTSTTGTPSTTTTTTGGSTCPGLTVSTVPRANGFYQDSNAFSQIYDITVLNNGNCPASSIVLSLATAGGVITSSWNIQASGPNYTFTNYGGQLLHGQSGSAGMILSFPTAAIPEGVEATLVSAACSC